MSYSFVNWVWLLIVGVFTVTGYWMGLQHNVDKAYKIGWQDCLAWIRNNLKVDV